MRQPAQQIQLSLYPSEHAFRRDQEFEVAELEAVAYEGAAQVSDEAGVWDEEVGEEDGYQGGDPDGDFVVGDAGENVSGGGR